MDQFPAKKAEKSKAEKSLKDAQMPPLPFAHQINKGNAEPKNKDAAVTVSEALEQIKLMQKFCDDIEKQLDEVYRLTGWTPQFLEAYFKNANNFSPEEWERVNKERQELMSSIMLPQDLEKEKEIAKKIAKPHETDMDPKTAKERRKKGAGMRRNWLPMR